MKKDREQKKADKDKIAQLTRELEKAQTDLKKDKLSTSTLSDALVSYKSDLKAKEAEIKGLELDLAAASKQIKLLELQVNKTDETCHELRDEKKRILLQVMCFLQFFLWVQCF